MFATLLDRRTSNRRLIPNDGVLGQEAVLFLLAGTDTVANVLTVVTYNTLANPDIRHKLVEELVMAIPAAEDSRSLTTEKLQKLPYMVSDDLCLIRRVNFNHEFSERLH